MNTMFLTRFCDVEQKMQKSFSYLKNPLKYPNEKSFSYFLMEISTLRKGNRTSSDVE